MLPDLDLLAARGHILVCGLNDVALRIVEQLHAAHQRVVVIDDLPDERLARIVAGLGVQLLNLSPQRSAVLERAGISGAAALLCVEADELRNLDIALLAHRLRPDLRIVVQLTNQQVGRALERVTGPGTVLDVAGLAAPSFTEACLQSLTHVITIGSEQFCITELVVEAGGTLRSNLGDLAPVAVVAAETQQVIVCPGRDLPVAAGDRVLVIATSGELDDRQMTAHGADPPRRSRVAAIWQHVVGVIADSERSFAYTLAALAVLTLTSVIILMSLYRHPETGDKVSALDAVYFTVETLTTVGFGDYSYVGEAAALRVWAIVLMIVGALLVAVIYAMVTNLLVSRRIDASLGSRKVRGMSDHVIVIGLGSVGLRVVEALVAAGESVVVLDHDENNRYLAKARSLKVPIVLADSTQQSSLEAVKLGRAKAVAVLTSMDLVNIETGLTIHELLGARRDEVPVVLRVFDRQLADTVEHTFGFSRVRSTAALAAPWFVGAALGLNILHTFFIQTQPMLIARWVVSADGALRGRTLLEVSARIRVIAISRADRPGELEHPPRRDTVLEGGDQVYLVGPYEELLDFLGRDGAGRGAARSGG